MHVVGTSVSSTIVCKSAVNEKFEGKIYILLNIYILINVFLKRDV